MKKQLFELWMSHIRVIPDLVLYTNCALRRHVFDTGLFK